MPGLTPIGLMILLSLFWPQGIKASLAKMFLRSLECGAPPLVIPQSLSDPIACVKQGPPLSSRQQGTWSWLKGLQDGSLTRWKRTTTFLTATQKKLPTLPDGHTWQLTGETLPKCVVHDGRANPCFRSSARISQVPLNPKP